jgi:hypothetical protein
VPNLSARDVDATFRGKMEAEVGETDHRVYVWRLDGRAVLRTELSTPLRELGPSLVAHIARRQLHLPNGPKSLVELVSCRMSREAWWEHVAIVAQDETRRLI